MSATTLEAPVTTGWAPGDLVTWRRKNASPRGRVVAVQETGLLVNEETLGGARLQLKVPWHLDPRKLESSELAPAAAGQLSLALTDDERDELREHEAVIEQGRTVFLEVGAALTAIRDKRLYRESHSSFEDYLRERWEISRGEAYRQIAAAEVVGSLSPMGDIPLPENERQARPLAKLPPEERQDAWREAVETAPDGKVTGAHVEAVVQERLPEEKRKPAPEPVAPPVPEPVTELGGYRVGDRVQWSYDNGNTITGEVAGINHGNLVIKPHGAKADVIAMFAPDRPGLIKLPEGWEPPAVVEPAKPVPTQAEVAEQRLAERTGAAKPGALKTAEERVAEQKAAETPSAPAVLTFPLAGAVKERFERLGGYPLPAIRAWCDLAELSEEHDLDPPTAIALLRRFLAFCARTDTAPDALLDEWEKRLPADDAEGEAGDG